jgi:predicted  nucleic acid-binding Zn-ribbon protein
LSNLETAAYSAAEVADGGAVTVRSDIYSLGLIIYFILTGKHAIDAGKLKSQSRILRRARAGVELELPGVGSGLAGLIKKLCSVRAEERPASMKEVLEMLVREKLAFFKDVDFAALRSELVKAGIDLSQLEKGAEPESERRATTTMKEEMEAIKRESATIRKELEAVKRESAAMKEELKAVKQAKSRAPEKAGEQVALLRGEEAVKCLKYELRKLKEQVGVLSEEVQNGPLSVAEILKECSPMPAKSEVTELRSAVERLRDEVRQLKAGREASRPVLTRDVAASEESYGASGAESGAMECLRYEVRRLKALMGSLAEEESTCLCRWRESKGTRREFQRRRIRRKARCCRRRWSA